MTTIRISVTPDDILKGQRADCASCPISLALRRADGKPWRTTLGSAQVFENGDSLDYCDITHEGQLPDEARNFVRDFDSHGQAEPFEFDFTYETREELDYE